MTEEETSLTEPSTRTFATWATWDSLGRLGSCRGQGLDSDVVALGTTWIVQQATSRTSDVVESDSFSVVFQQPQDRHSWGRACARSSSDTGYVARPVFLPQIKDGVNPRFYTPVFSNLYSHHARFTAMYEFLRLREELTRFQEFDKNGDMVL